MLRPVAEIQNAMFEHIDGQSVAREALSVFQAHRGLDDGVRYKS